jgi:hypothetical protein
MSENIFETFNKIFNEGKHHKNSLTDPQSFYEKFENTLYTLEKTNIKYKLTIEKLEKYKISENNFYLILEEIKEQDMLFKQTLYKLLEIHKLCAELEGKDEIVKEQDNWLKQIEPFIK